MGLSATIDGFFRISERGSSVRTEVKGGILVFLAMSYIIAVNSQMMVAAGVDEDAAFTATVLMSAVGCVVMGLYARYPAAMAPGMGINAMFCYTAVGALGFTWQEALVAVIVSGVLFFVLTISGLRKRVMDRIPRGLKSGIIAGIGCFIAFVGLQNAGIIADSSTLVALGDLSDPVVLLGILCIAVTVLAVTRGMSVGIILGMAVTVVVGVVLGIIDVPSSPVSVPEAPPAGAFLDGLTDGLMSVGFVVLVIAFAFVEFFDGSGTLMALSRRSGLAEDGEGSYDRALNVDAGVASLSGVVGCTPTIAYAESTVGVEAGARTGLMPIVVAVMFCLALFVSPVFQMVTYSCTVGAMVVVGASMMTELRGVEWDDRPMALAVTATILFMVLAYSITDGIAFGLIVYCLAMIGAGRWRDVSPVLYVLSVVFAAYLLMAAIQL